MIKLEGNTFQSKKSGSDHARIPIERKSDLDRGRNNLVRRDHECVCVWCQEMFMSFSKKGKYCSDSCKHQSMKSTRKYKSNLQNIKLEERECKYCKKMFNPVNCNNIYCTKNCCKLVYKKISEGYSKGIFGGKNNKLSRYYRLRFEIIKRDDFRCQYCGKNVKEDKIKLHLDHVVPRAKGGTNTPDNLVASCEECNLGKKDVLLSERRYKKELFKISSDFKTT